MLIKLAALPHRGVLIDHQQDSGAVFGEEFAAHWPAQLEPPRFGVQRGEGDCIVKLAFDRQQRHSYPVATPSDVMASSMYLGRFGRQYLDDESFSKIASALEGYRRTYSMPLPESYRQAFLGKIAGQRPVAQVVDRPVADPHGRWAIDSPEAVKIAAQQIAADRVLLSEAERFVAMNKTAAAAEFFGLAEELQLAPLDRFGDAIFDELSKRARWAGVNAFDELWAGPYLAHIENITHAIKQAAYQPDQRRLMFEVVGSLERLEKQAGLDRLWGTAFARPSEAVGAYAPDVMAELEAEAMESHRAFAPQVDVEKVASYLGAEMAQQVLAQPSLLDHLPDEVRYAVQRSTR